MLKVFKTIDSVGYDEFKLIELHTIHSFLPHCWRCTTKVGNFVDIICKDGYLMISHEELEYNARHTFAIIAIVEIRGSSPTLPEILDYMGWEVEPNAIWDH